MNPAPSLQSLTETREGWVWPAEDDVAFRHIRMYIPLLKLAARQAPERRVAVQAGGNAGMYPAILAPMFDRVITFEPEALNFYCLSQNCQNFDNVEAYEGVVGNADNKVGLARRAGWDGDKECVNTGSIEVHGDGPIPQFRIDDLDLPHLDFLQLDVEGYELKALEGAADTIDKHSPVIMLESYEHGADPRAFVEELGYHRIIKGDYDQVYVRQRDGTQHL